ncbi:DUF2303 family protein [Ruania rhizosphaerae]|uniref:DUF2303 family protein n=1 Tax=Ruania rhizosphaerae TaxID=1840413 RepID=UPI00135AF063|nr:DUF2303 family protein [Ruania rhizosphaerae]
MSERTDAGEIVSTAYAATRPHPVNPDEHPYQVITDGDGNKHLLDLSAHTSLPRRKKGRPVVRDAASFTAYVNRHTTAGTEIYADATSTEVVAILDGNGDTAPGWGDHRVSLGLVQPPAWKAWNRLSGQMVDQQTFAEHIENRLVDIVKPTGADMLELAQTFQATKSAAFDSSQRLSTGEVQLSYKEQVDAKGGKSGRMDIPETFELGLIPFEGAKAYRVVARFRYRLHESVLRVGFVLERPEDVLRAAFDDVLDAIRTGVPDGVPIFHGQPG